LKGRKDDLINGLGMISRLNKKVSSNHQGGIDWKNHLDCEIKVDLVIGEHKNLKGKKRNPIQRLSTMGKLRLTFKNTHYAQKIDPIWKLGLISKGSTTQRKTRSN
jgi:hypothetical protein